MGGIPNNSFIITQRRDKVLLMLSQGLNEAEIAKELNVGQSTISRDLKKLKKESRERIESIIEEVLPYEYRKSVLSIEQIIKECWKIYNDTSSKWTSKNKLDALKLIKESNSTRHEILIEGPFNLRALQMEQKVKELVEESEVPKKSFMNLGLPTWDGKRNDDLR